MATRQPTHQTRTFGAEVTRLRQEAGIPRTELAARTSVTSSYIAQVERGATRCRRDFAERLDTALNSGTQIAQAWDKLLKSAKYPKFFTDYPEAEAAAAFLRSYESNLVNGLLQTENYARVLLRDDGDFDNRMRRQALITRPAAPTPLAVVLDESVLYRLVGTVEVMREQCGYLLEASDWEHISLQIAPMAYYRGVHTSFHIASQPNGEDIVHLTTSNAGITSSTPEDTIYANKAFSMLQARALSAGETQIFIRKVVSERWS